MNANVDNVSAAEGRSRSAGGKVSTLFGDAFSNWRLLLLAVTGLVLSLASGWTTWDGMSNFTCPNIDSKNAEPCVAPRILSGMITFGIQGVMLIIAWIIGETFAKNRSEQRLHRSGWFGGGLLLAAMLTVLAALAAVLADQADNLAGIAQNLGDFGFPAIPTSLGWWLAVGAILAFVLARKELAARYISGFKTILSHLPLWIMFLACMATSVFFSFDSLFSTIFPQGERVRAAKLRVENQVAGVMSDVQAQLAVRRLAATRALFTSSQWREFDRNLNQLVAQAEAAPDAVQKQKLERLSQSRNAQAEIRGVISTSKANKRTLEAELARLETETKDVATRRAPAQQQVALIEEQLVAKRAEIVTAQTAAEGERQGVRGTGNAGAGPEFRRLRKIVQNLELDASELDTKLKTAQSRVAGLNDEESGKRARMAEIGRELIALDEKIKEADDKKAVLEQTGLNTIAGDLDAAGGIKALDVARNRFRRAPVEEGLDQLEQLCTSLLANLRSVASLKAKTADVNCEPGDASVLANGIFRLQKAEAAFRANCTSGDKLPRNSANKLLKFGSVCIQDSGLPGADTEEFRTQLNRIALNRDDKAHRFVVSWNAFSDGNALAYLALAIAIAIDGLVFMSGLFGASVIRSPLSAISEEELERVIDNALGDNKHKTLKDTMDAIEENPDAGRSSFCHQIAGHVTRDNARIKRVVAAGRDLDVVRWEEDSGAGRHLLHADFNKALQEASNRHHESFITDSNDDPADKALAIMQALKPKLINALQTRVYDNANAVLGEIHPSSERVGYMGYVEKPAQSFWAATRKALGRNGSGRNSNDRAKGNDWYLQRAISVGTREGMVKTDDEGEIFYIRPLFFDALNEIRAEYSVVTSQPERSTQRPVEGTTLAASGEAPTVVQPYSTEAAQPLSQAETTASIGNVEKFPAPSTVAIDEQDRRDEIVRDVRQEFKSRYQLDDAQFTLMLSDASASREVLAQLRAIPGRISNAFVDRIEEELPKLLREFPRLPTMSDADYETAQLELELLATAHIGHALFGRLHATAENLLKRADGTYPLPGDDRPVLGVIAEHPNLVPIMQDLHNLRVHEHFDHTLVANVRAAEKAELIIQELEAANQAVELAHRAVND